MAAKWRWRRSSSSSKKQVATARSFGNAASAAATSAPSAAGTPASLLMSCRTAHVQRRARRRSDGMVMAVPRRDSELCQTEPATANPPADRMVPQVVQLESALRHNQPPVSKDALASTCRGSPYRAHDRSVHGSHLRASTESVRGGLSVESSCAGLQPGPLSSFGIDGPCMTMPKRRRIAGSICRLVTPTCGSRLLSSSSPDPTGRAHSDSITARVITWRRHGLASFRRSSGSCRMAPTDRDHARASAFK